MALQQDFVVDEKGWPTFVMPENSLLTKMIDLNPNVTFFCTLPFPIDHLNMDESPLSDGQSDPDVNRFHISVGIMGDAMRLSAMEVDTSSENIIFDNDVPPGFLESDKSVVVFKLKPRLIYLGPSNRLADKSALEWVSVRGYETSRPEAVVSGSPAVKEILSRINSQRSQDELLSLLMLTGECVPTGSEVRVSGIDGKGIVLSYKKPSQYGQTTELQSVSRKVLFPREVINKEMLCVFVIV
jgi:hypothetical protein